MSNWEKYLKEIYLDPSHPASFGSPERLYKIVKQGSHVALCRALLWASGTIKSVRVYYESGRVHCPRNNF